MRAIAERALLYYTANVIHDSFAESIRERIARRFEKMVEAGAVGEVQALLGLGLDPAMPAMKAIGVPEIVMAIGGEIPLQEAVERATIATRQYAKRQATWFRHQLGTEWERRETTF